MHTVTVRRWEVAIAFITLTVAFVIGLAVVNHRVSKKEFKSSVDAHRNDDCIRSHALLAYLGARQKQVNLNDEARTLFLRYRHLVLSDC